MCSDEGFEDLKCFSNMIFYFQGGAIVSDNLDPPDNNDGKLSIRFLKKNSPHIVEHSMKGRADQSHVSYHHSSTNAPCLALLYYVLNTRSIDSAIIIMAFI